MNKFRDLVVWAYMPDLCICQLFSFYNRGLTIRGSKVFWEKIAASRRHALLALRASQAHECGRGSFRHPSTSRVVFKSSRILEPLKTENAERNTVQTYWNKKRVKPKLKNKKNNSLSWYSQTIKMEDKEELKCWWWVVDREATKRYTGSLIWLEELNLLNSRRCQFLRFCVKQNVFLSVCMSHSIYSEMARLIFTKFGEKV